MEQTLFIYGISFAQNGKMMYVISEKDTYLPGHLVITETSRGLELGRILTSKKTATEAIEAYPFILREASDEDVKVFEANVEQANSYLPTIQKEAEKLSLAMRVIAAEYTLDRSKLSITYLSEERVDFRELLKILASIYHCRIDLRQIGTRDKAKMIGGVGICGLPLCCSTFLNEFDGISITMAKNQMLALNIPKLSGHCGKLICCLKYEDQTYTDEKQSLPRVGLRVRYNDDIYRIAAINILTKMVRLENPSSMVTVPLKDIENTIIPRENNEFYQGFSQPKKPERNDKERPRRHHDSEKK